MPKFINLTGYVQPDGWLEVLRRGHTRFRAVYWVCRCLRCNSGAEFEVRAQYIRDGNTRSCGCLEVSTRVANLDRSGVRTAVDRVGDRYGTTRVLRRHDVPNADTAWWWVVCERCGHEWAVRSSCLARGSWRCRCYPSNRRGR